MNHRIDLKYNEAKNMLTVTAPTKADANTTKPIQGKNRKIEISFILPCPETLNLAYRNF